MPSPDGEMMQQRWWVDPKGRTGTVEKSAVQEVVLNAQGRDDIDVLIIVTNTTFSNPTRDWVSETMRSRPRLNVRLWDRVALERLLVKHPSAVLRVFSKALSPQGRLEVMRYRLWNLSVFTDVRTLTQLWTQRENLQWNYDSRFAALVSELANGNLAMRPWMSLADDQQVAECFVNALGNLLYLLSRADEAGVDQVPYIGAVVHLLFMCLLRLTLNEVRYLINLGLSDGDQKPYPEKAYNYLLQFIFHRAFLELQEVCSDKCDRVIVDDKVALSDEEIEVYWKRFQFDPTTWCDIDIREQERYVLILEEHAGHCAVGFDVSKVKACPLVEFSIEERNDIGIILATLQNTVKFRTEEPKRFS